jgi:hypothetical protein
MSVINQAVLPENEVVLLLILLVVLSAAARLILGVVDSHSTSFKSIP